jgi:1-acyl-sn-glycerol-3-phosphate acyltransferase
MVGSAIERKVHFMAKYELFKIPIFGKIFYQLGAFPVKRGGVSKESFKTAITLLDSGKVMCMFPEGTRNSSTGTMYKGAARIALKSNATVIPVAIVGKYKWFRPMKIVYGAPLDMSEFHQKTSEDIENATEKIMSTIRTMHQNNS